jgi:hypothetical protein
MISIEQLYLILIVIFTGITAILSLTDLWSKYKPSSMKVKTEPSTLEVVIPLHQIREKSVAEYKGIKHFHCWSFPFMFINTSGEPVSIDGWEPSFDKPNDSPIVFGFGIQSPPFVLNPKGWIKVELVSWITGEPDKARPAELKGVLKLNCGGRIFKYKKVPYIFRIVP